MVYNRPPQLGTRPLNQRPPVPQYPQTQAPYNLGPIGGGINTLTNLPGQATNVLGEAGQIASALGQAASLLGNLQSTITESTKLVNQVTQLVIQVNNLVGNVHNIFNPASKIPVPPKNSNTNLELAHLYQEAQKILGSTPQAQQAMPQLTPQQLAQLYAQLYGNHQ